MEDEELVKMFNLTLKMRETILFFLIVVNNGLIWIVLDIGLDKCAKGRRRVEVKGKWISLLDHPTWQPIQDNYHICWWVNGPN